MERKAAPYRSSFFPPSSQPWNSSSRNSQTSSPSAHHSNFSWFFPNSIAVTLFRLYRVLFAKSRRRLGSECRHRNGAFMTVWTCSFFQLFGDDIKNFPIILHRRTLQYSWVEVILKSCFLHYSKNTAWIVHATNNGNGSYYFSKEDASSKFHMFVTSLNPFIVTPFSSTGTEMPKTKVLWKLMKVYKEEVSMMLMTNFNLN